MSKTDTSTIAERNQQQAAAIAARYAKKVARRTAFEFPVRAEVGRMRSHLGTVRGCMYLSAFFLVLALIIKWAKPDEQQFITTTHGQVEQLTPSRIEYE